MKTDFHKGNILHDRCMKPIPYTREHIVDSHLPIKCPNCTGRLFPQDTVSLTPFHEHVSLISMTDKHVLEMFVESIRYGG